VFSEKTSKNRRTVQRFSMVLQQSAVLEKRKRGFESSPRIASLAMAQGHCSLRSSAFGDVLRTACLRRFFNSLLADPFPSSFYTLSLFFLTPSPFPSSFYPLSLFFLTPFPFSLFCLSPFPLLFFKYPQSCSPLIRLATPSFFTLVYCSVVWLSYFEAS
jgi:hypothetical protein